VEALRRTTDAAGVRKIINSTYITLDGVVEAPDQWPDFFEQRDERFGEIQAKLLFSCDAMVMGRHTYDGFAPVWPARSDPFSDHINAMPKHVVSTTLKDPEWTNTSVIAEDAAGALARLKEAPGRDIVQYGFGTVSRLLLEHGLLDRLRLWVHPLILGKGAPADLLFGETRTTGVELEDTTVLNDGIVLLDYRIGTNA
jgi:dihydrofolate reductase